VGPLAWYWSNTCFVSACGTRPVGGKLANAFGFYDMLGNVSEWVNDWYGVYTADAQTNPTGPASSTTRVVRGGDWWGISWSLRSSIRDTSEPHDAFYLRGFRVARNP
jgi:formylglycine-generating enzyme required for sulfatase activity